MMVDINRLSLAVYSGKGGKDWVTVLPETIVPEITQQMHRVKFLNL